MAKGDYKSDLTLDERVIIGVIRSSEILKKRYTSLLQNYGLTFSQYGVLRALNSLEGGENTMTSIRNIMLVSGANMTGVAKRLEKKGLILKKQDPKDERVKLLKITPKGLNRLKHVKDEKNQYLKKCLKDYTEDTKAQLVSMLKILIKNA